ncbi:putative bifunctional diguanylate cyclase/phosphodiesterase [Lacibacterium aquatile]|uniref:Bifunctional diguanylate cyclase/phosphodiesterase n=1 Tax=Lacibacterium aquatile TaxID=1168082 RepID=A0ABW5DRN5_9PROT
MDNLSPDPMLEQRIRQQIGSLRDLAARPVRTQAEFDAILGEIVTSAASLLNVGRASLWMFDDQQQSLRCVAFHGSADYPSAVGQQLPATKAPTYFAALRDDRLFVSNDTSRDFRLQGLEAHIAASNIRAMLDAPIVNGNHRWGAICVSDVEGARPWRSEEEGFLTSLADICAMAVAAFARAEAENRLSDMQARLSAMSGVTGLEASVDADRLTGLPGRSALYKGINGAADAFRALSGPPYALVVIDCDDLGKVNESLGKAGGDATLVALAARLAETVAERGLLARLRSDEFGLLLSTGIDRPGMLERVVEDLDNAMRLPLQVMGRAVSLTLSIGVAQPHSAEEATEEVLRNAATAMRKAKAMGGGRSMRYLPKMRADAVQRLEIETELLTALETDQLRLSYQPIMSANPHTLMGFEALIRWHHPVKGLIPPDEFIPHAEQSHLIFAIGDKTIGQACAQLAEWRRLAPNYPVTISVNLSARQLLDQNLVEMVDRHIQRHDVAPGSLKLELTETSIIANPAYAAAQISALRKRGIPVVIDDFGTGYSSFNHLADYEVDGLKIDKKFIYDLGKSRLSGAIVKALMSLAHSLELDVVAEGVETDEVAAELGREGKAALQGWLFAPALPAEQATQYLLSEARGMRGTA